MNRLKYLLVVISVLVLILGAFGVTAQENVLVIGWSENTDAYDPANGFTHSTHIINHVTYSQLVTFPDEDASQILPQLADSWKYPKTERYTLSRSTRMPPLPTAMTSPLMMSYFPSSGCKTITAIRLSWLMALGP